MHLNEWLINRKRKRERKLVNCNCIQHWKAVFDIWCYSSCIKKTSSIHSAESIEWHCVWKMQLRGYKNAILICATLNLNGVNIGVWYKSESIFMHWNDMTAPSTYWRIITSVIREWHKRWLSSSYIISQSFSLSLNETWIMKSSLQLACTNTSIASFAMSMQL